ncbi:hypothetical protein Tco_1244359 [Tanacetum coccineum]
MANLDDEPMWAADHVVAPTPGTAITIPATANEFAVKARNEHVNAIYTRRGKSYDPPTNPNNSQNQNDSQAHIDFNSDDEDEEPTPQPQTPKPNKEAPTPMPYKPRISYPQRLRKEKMEAQYKKFLDMIHDVRINVPLIDVLAGMLTMVNFS